MFGTAEPTRAHTLSVDPVGVSPVAVLLYEPADRPLFGDPARAALDAVLPEGRHTTYGYSPLPDDAYVRRDGTYYQIATTVTGRRRLSRTTVALDPVEEEAVPDGALLVDDLARPAARVVTILHSHAQGGAWACRIRCTRGPLRELAHTALAFEVADTRAAFREIVFGAHVDTELTGPTLPDDQRQLLERAIDAEGYTESVPLSAAFGRLLDRLGVGRRDGAVDGLRLWYDEEYYRYGLYVDESDSGDPVPSGRTSRGVRAAPPDAASTTRLTSGSDSSPDESR